METVYLALGLLVVFLALTIPIGVAIGFAILIALYFGDISLMLFSQHLSSTFESFPLLAVPAFIMAGSLMQHGSLANNLLALCRVACGHLRGALAHISVLTSLMYGALSGSSVATVAAVGGTMIPAMEKEGYPRLFATAVNASSGTLGVIIPPSIPIIIYGATSGLSVSTLFIASILPGILVAAGFMVIVAITVARHNYGEICEKSTWAQRVAALKQGSFSLGVPIIVLGGIYGGITTPTEAGVIAVFYALIVECFITKSMSFKLLHKVMLDTLQTTGMLLIILICASSLGNLMVFNNVQSLIQDFILNFTDSQTGFLLIMFVLFLTLGCIMEASPIIMILVPILQPVAISFGIDPIQFALFMFITLTVGFLTPPVGNNLFVGASVGKVNMLHLAKACTPFILSMMVVALLIGFVPFISLCLVK